MLYLKPGKAIRIILMAAAIVLPLVLLNMYFQPKPPASLEEYMEKEGESPIFFSEGSGFYDSELSLELTAPGILPRGAAICYTLDGTEPDAKSGRYTEPVVLRKEENPHRGEREKYETETDAGRAGDTSGSTSSQEAGTDSAGGADYAPDHPASGITVFTVRAKIIAGEESTRTQCAVYCVGSGLLPCQDTFIVCLDTEAKGLYDYEKGILVGGKDLADHNFSIFHGNYMKEGDDWTRLCHVAIFDGEGRLLQNKDAGLAVSGGMSRRLDQKSFNLSAGSPYGKEGDRFYLDVFPDAAESEYAHVGSYTHLRLRARSQVPRTFRETLIGRLAEESGIRASVEPRRGIVFLNGEFYTLADIEPTFSSSLLAHRFDLPDTEHIEKEKGKESSVFRKLGLTDLFAADLTRKKNRDALEKAVDMDDYLLEYAFNILANNLDWPRNNVEAWHYSGDYDPARPFTDGRFRFMIFDSDKALNADPELTPKFGADNLTSIMENVLLGKDSSFPNVMKAEEYRNRFFSILSDLMNTSFEKDHVLSLIRECYAEAETEISAYYTEEYKKKIEEDLAGALSLAETRNEVVLSDLETWFGIKDRYNMELSAGEGVSITWDAMYLASGSEYRGEFFSGVPVSLAARTAPGWRFDHWEVNGKEYRVKKEEDLKAGRICLQLNGKLSGGETCQVRAAAVREKGERLIISQVSTAGKNDWIILYNAGSSDLDTGRYCISDDPDDPQKFRLPPSELEPGETCRINGHRNENGSALCLCNFNLSQDETLTLTPDAGSGLTGDSVRIPRMSRGCSYGRRDNGNTWCWFNPDRGDEEAGEMEIIEAIDEFAEDLLEDF